MKSEIIGEMEDVVRPMVEQIRAASIVGCSITLTPEMAGAVSNTLEKLAQEYDALAASRRIDGYLMRTSGIMLMIISLYILIT